MEDRRERNGRMSVPQFGSWDNQGGGGPNPADGYTMVFTKARADRKENKAKTIPDHIANLNENNNPPPKPHHHRPRHNHHHNHHHHGPEHRHSHQFGQDEAARKKNILTYLNCCIRP